MTEVVYYNGSRIFIPGQHTNDAMIMVSKKSLTIKKEIDLDDPEPVDIPGGDLFRSYFLSSFSSVSIFDRTGNISVPINIKLMDHMKLPEPSSSPEFSDICDARARELIQHAISTGRKLAVMYSGGVDSTLILCSLLKNATPEELKHVIVLMSTNSVAENPNFFYSHIIRHFECAPSHKFQHYLGNNDYVFVTGENADQLFGSQVTESFIYHIGADQMFDKINPENIARYFRCRLKTFGREHHAEDLTRVLLKLTSAAPIPIDTNYKFFWWLNFAMKWQSVYIRILGFCRHFDTLKVEDNYTTFFTPADFQRWSMNNAGQHGDPTKPYKSTMKKYIFDVNSDSSYMLKPKVSSLLHLVERKESIFTIDVDMKPSLVYPDDSYFNYNNSFVI